MRGERGVKVRIEDCDTSGEGSIPSVHTTKKYIGRPWHAPRTTPETRDEIRALRNSGWTYKQLRAKFHLSHSYMHRIVTGIKYKSGGG